MLTMLAALVLADTPVVNDKEPDESACPSMSVIPDEYCRLYCVFANSVALGVKVAVLPSDETAVVPGNRILLEAPGENEMVLLVAVHGSIGLLN